MTSPPGCDDGDGAFAVPAAAGIREPVLNWLQRSKGIRWIPVRENSRKVGRLTPLEGKGFLEKIHGDIMATTETCPPCLSIKPSFPLFGKTRT